MEYIIHTDGGARGNPGPAAIGVVIESPTTTTNRQLPDSPEAESRRLIAAFGKRIGEATNNVAEYTAVIEALHEVKRLTETGREGRTTVHFFLDSNLVVQQLNGTFRIKDAALGQLLTRVKILEREIGAAVTYAYVPRERNRRADFLVNQALDEAGRSQSPHVRFS